jgi:hypothetical protein
MKPAYTGSTTLSLLSIVKLSASGEGGHSAHSSLHEANASKLGISIYAIRFMLIVQYSF